MRACSSVTSSWTCTAWPRSGRQRLTALSSASRSSFMSRPVAKHPRAARRRVMKARGQFRAIPGTPGTVHAAGIRETAWSGVARSEGFEPPAFCSVDSAARLGNLGTWRLACQDRSHWLASSSLVLQRYTANFRPVRTAAAEAGARASLAASWERRCAKPALRRACESVAASGPHHASWRGPSAISARNVWVPGRVKSV